MARKNKPVVVETPEVVVETPEVVVETPEVVVETHEVVVEASLLSSLTQNLEEVVSKEVTETKAEKNTGVGIFIKKLINEGLSNKDILKVVHEQYGNNNTSYACVAWYRNKMKKTGVDVAKASSLDWVQDFAKRTGLSEENITELTLKVA